MKKLILFAIVCGSIFAGCYYDKTDELNPGAGLFTPCDTTHPVTYSHHITYILENYCYSCHSGANPTSHVNLDSYSSLNTQVQNGNLWGDVSGGGHGHNQMPPTFVLDSCYIKQFDYWINVEGGPNN